MNTEQLAALKQKIHDDVMANLTPWMDEQLRRFTEAPRIVFEPTYVPARRDMGGFDPSVAAKVGAKGHTLMDTVEAVLEKAGWDRESVADRRRALGVALALRPDLDPGPADRERIATGYAKNAGTKRKTTEELNADVAAAFREWCRAEGVNWYDYRARSEAARRFMQENPDAVVRYSQHGDSVVAVPGNDDERQAYAEETAQRLGVSLSDYEGKRRVMMAVAKERPDLIPTRYGRPQVRGTDPSTEDRPADDRRDHRHAGVTAATTYADARAAVMERDGLSPGNPEHVRRAARSVAAERPDLLGYGRRAA